jgi:hypothetical protein
MPQMLGPAAQGGANFRFFGRRNLVAIAVCAAIAGPTTLIMVLIWSAITYPDFPVPESFGTRDIVGTAIVLCLSSAYGLVGGLPAAILNSTLHLTLVKHRRDRPFGSAVSGSFFGAVFGYVVVASISYDPRYETKLEIMYPLALAGALIGFLYWVLAVRHYRLPRS